jgi:hypothetical protein
MANYGIKNIYRYYKEHSSDPVSEKIFASSWKSFANKVTDGIVYQGKDFGMPFRLGPIGIRKQKVIVVLNPDGSIDKRYLRPDWKATKELWIREPAAKERKQLVFHLNKHFNGYNCKWYWDKSQCSISNQSAYSFVPTRENKRKLADAIFDDDREVDYYEHKPKTWKNQLTKV